MFKKGDCADFLYVIVDGLAGVVIKDKETGEKTEVADMAAGEHFGETALFEEGSKRTDVVVKGDLHVMCITKETFLQQRKSTMAMCAVCVGVCACSAFGARNNNNEETMHVNMVVCFVCFGCLGEGGANKRRTT